MENLTYVTGNYGKYISIKEQFEQYGLSINYFKHDLDEPDVNDIGFISKAKAKQAYEIIGRPVFVTDSGFYIENYPNKVNYPGAFVKRSGVSSNIDKLLKDMEKVNDRSCYFLDCLTFYDGENYYQFFGKSLGVLSYTKKGIKHSNAKSNLWYVFIPNNCMKTLAEMTDYERNHRNDNHTSAAKEFITWYLDVYLQDKSLIKNLKI